MLNGASCRVWSLAADREQSVDAFGCRVFLDGARTVAGGGHDQGAARNGAARLVVVVAGIRDIVGRLGHHGTDKVAAGEPCDGTQDPGARRCAEAQVDDIGAIVGGRIAIGVHGVQDRFGQDPGVAHALRVQDAQWHDAGSGRGRENNAGHMRAMAEACIVGRPHFRRIEVAVHEVVTRQESSGQQGMAGVHAGIEHRDSHAGAGGDAQRIRKVQAGHRPLRLVLLRRADGPDQILARLGAAVDDVLFGQFHTWVRARGRPPASGRRPVDAVPSRKIGRAPNRSLRVRPYLISSGVIASDWLSLTRISPGTVAVSA